MYTSGEGDSDPAGTREWRHEAAAPDSGPQAAGNPERRGGADPPAQGHPVPARPRGPLHTQGLPRDGQGHGHRTWVLCLAWQR